MRSVETILSDIKKYKDFCTIYKSMKEEVSKFARENGIEFLFHQHLSSKEFHDFVEGNLSMLRNELAKARDE